MRFPGQRIAKHYFPVTRRTRCLDHDDAGASRNWTLVGLDQVLVDMEVATSEAFAVQAGIKPGESLVLPEQEHLALVREIRRQGFPCRFAAGGTVANTLNNYGHLSGEPAVLLGTLPQNIRPGSRAFHYVAQTPKIVDLGNLRTASGPVGTTITFVFPDGERSFAVSPGVSNNYSPEDLPEDVVCQASAALTSLYTLSDPDWPIARATLRLMSLANQADVPVAFGLGTAGLVRRMRSRVQEILQQHVTIAAMNEREAEVLTGIDDPLLACRHVLEWVDLAIVTQGPKGLIIGGYVDRAQRRQTRLPLQSGALREYNRWEYSRLMCRKHCEYPLQTFSLIHPYRGGPDRLTNCSGAGDAALAAVLHDVVANRYHRAHVPESKKHLAGVPFLTYSSLSRNAQYANRVAYEVLQNSSPRLDGPVGSDRLRRQDSDNRNSPLTPNESEESSSTPDQLDFTF